MTRRTSPASRRARSASPVSLSRQPLRSASPVSFSRQLLRSASPANAPCQRPGLVVLGNRLSHCTNFSIGTGTRAEHHVRVALRACRVSAVLPAPRCRLLRQRLPDPRFSSRVAPTQSEQPFNTIGRPPCGRSAEVLARVWQVEPAAGVARIGYFFSRSAMVFRSSRSSATEASIFARAKSLCCSPGTMLHLVPFVVRGKLLISPGSTP